MWRSQESALRRELGTSLKQARLAKGMKVRELAARTGLDVSSIYSLERGRWFPSFTNLFRLVRVLDVELDLQITSAQSTVDS